MATEIINFIPSVVEAPNYQITLDGQSYTMIVTWNLFAQRYYINIYTLSNELVLAQALVGSREGIDLQAISWANGFVTITTSTPHGIRIGDVVLASIVGAVPVEYNGVFEMLVIAPDKLRYQLAVNPGLASVAGAIQQNINMVEGLFTSTLIFRQANSQFEITG